MGITDPSVLTIWRNCRRLALVLTLFAYGGVLFIVAALSSRLDTIAWQTRMLPAFSRTLSPPVPKITMSIQPLQHLRHSCEVE